MKIQSWHHLLYAVGISTKFADVKQWERCWPDNDILGFVTPDDVWGRCERCSPIGGATNDDPARRRRATPVLL
ncbi:MAG: hypothetical protein ACREA0_34305, partial [bacterium]